MNMAKTGVRVKEGLPIHFEFIGNRRILLKRLVGRFRTFFCGKLTENKFKSSGELFRFALNL